MKRYRVRGVARKAITCALAGSLAFSSFGVPGVAFAKTTEQLQQEYASAMAELSALEDALAQAQADLGKTNYELGETKTSIADLQEKISNIEADCEARLARMREGAPRRYLLSIGGAGAQQKLFEDIICHLLPDIRAGKAMLLVNTGDHFEVWDSIAAHIPELKGLYTTHFDDYEAAKAFLEKGEGLTGVQVFCHKDIFAAVYVTNLLMRVCDVLLTKPSELSFYPVPKIMIHRVGGHEAWGAIRAAEVGDGTYECEKTEEVLAMLDEITDGDEILPALCRGILRAKNAGIYDGAYKAVKLAVEK